MKLRKDDPIYYRNKIRDLIIEARENGIKAGYTVDYLERPQLTFVQPGTRVSIGLDMLEEESDGQNNRD